MSRRSGRSKSSATGTSRTPDHDNVTENSPENAPEIDEQGEITRCICGNDEISTTNSALEQLLLQEYSIHIDNGLFIQCDKCLVWQHGYCVGLFIDDDVPDKYWCEECKPALHLFVTDSEDQSPRTLYRPVNDKRRVLMDFLTSQAGSADRWASDDSLDKTEAKSEKLTRLRARRSPTSAGGADQGMATKDLEASSANILSTRQTRKERRHGEETFDEQLQRALRESAASNEKKRAHESGAGAGPGSKRAHSEDLDNEVNDSNLEEETDPKTGKRDTRVKTKTRPKLKLRAQGPRASTPKPKEAASEAETSKEELLSQPSRPRFVNDKSSIYELRKRTGAILEWLGRSQMELEEERDTKALQFKEANVEGAGLLLLVEENSKLMENLTEKILAWEQRFGKYAP